MANIEIKILIQLTGALVEEDKVFKEKSSGTIT